MENCTHIIGIDLGTSNSALSWKRVGEDLVHELQIEQQIAHNLIGSLPYLPSVLYFPHDNESLSNSINFRYNMVNTPIVGTFAREKSIQAPDRSVISAKSWLCHKNMDPASSILPWQSEFENLKVSPIEASVCYLEHLKQAFENHMTSLGEQCHWNTIEIILTVPASFDEVARTHTHHAAKKAGFLNIRLLEEPQAAFYSWLEAHNKDWKKLINVGDTILVCDIGGGTTDFSLITLEDHNNSLQLNRLSVGEHLLLGGDNIDLALAYALKDQLEQQGHKVDHWKFLSLINSARDAKEKILTHPQLNEISISVAGRSSNLFASVNSTQLSRETVENIVLHGFFAATNLHDLPSSQDYIGLNEIGLQYENEPCVSKHLAQFLLTSEKNNNLKNLRPNKILFNGGVFNSSIIQNKILQLLNTWFPTLEIAVLSNDNLQTAVARGAVFYGHIRKSNLDLKIKSGTTKSYYIGVAATGMAIPGMKPKIKGVCVVPKGSEEGSEFSLSQQKFGLMTGKKVFFRFFSSSERQDDHIGIIVNDAEKELHETANLEVQIPASQNENSAIIPVSLHGEISDVGILHLFMVDPLTNQKWDLQFNVREQS